MRRSLAASERLPFARSSELVAPFARAPLVLLTVTVLTATPHKRARPRPVRYAVPSLSTPISKPSTSFEPSPVFARPNCSPIASPPPADHPCPEWLPALTPLIWRFADHPPLGTGKG